MNKDENVSPVIEVPGASPHKVDVLCHPALLGIELKNGNSPIAFANTDPDVDFS